MRSRPNSDEPTASWACSACRDGGLRDDVDRNLRIDASYCLA